MKTTKIKKSNKLNILQPHKWGIVRIYRDIKNYRDWIKTIKKEEANKASKYNKFELQHNIFYNVFLVVSLDQTDADLSEDIKKAKVVEMLTSINRYLDEELLFAESLA